MDGTKESGANHKRGFYHTYHIAWLCLDLVIECKVTAAVMNLVYKLHLINFSFIFMKKRVGAKFSSKLIRI